ncbi:MerR family transcriptional regulator [Bacillus sp. WLY-B-L8]|uniref:MerR family transcriptional regulator n=1 Tax=Bacillus multifaciens TaxID=3068506 RepID=UPI002741456F|nr:MerR family transcriptional regulator [Bacillus sp. WLY-B-L8]MDP7981439.1 MerR family transcriptional regulator [Bacillus sp. WLY-B-L8]
MERYEYVLLNKEMSERLGIGISTLRKWAASLEKNGYGWEKNEDGTRYYTRYDEDTLILFKTLVKEQKFNLEQAAKVIVSRRQGGRSLERAGGALQENKKESPNETHSDTRSLNPISTEPSVLTEEAIQSLMNYVKDQEQLNKSLIEKIQEMEQERNSYHALLEKIEDERKADRELLKQVGQQLKRQEERTNERDKMLMENIRSIQQLAAAKEEERKKKGFFSNLFSR